ncbi:hypothetical protein AGMMS50229_14970 [Campylobacterota bacterium]|nr:hypothetical protein AGMMS50229_14970 [Campylobacterota bacterium]
MKKLNDWEMRLRVKPAMTRAPAMTGRALRMTGLRALLVVGLFALLPVSLQALQIFVVADQTGINGALNNTNANPALVRANARLDIRVRALLRNIPPSNDNWGCTSYTIASTGKTYYYNHANSRVLVPNGTTRTTPTRTSGDFPTLIAAPNGANGQKIEIKINFYSGNLSGGQCSGAKQAIDNPNSGDPYTFSVWIQITQAQKNIDLSLRSSRNIKGDMKVIGNTAVCIPATDLGGNNYNHYYDKTTGANANNKGRLYSSTDLCQNPQKSRYADQEDDNLMYAFIDKDGNLIASIDKSNTMAQLSDLPINAKIVEAKLYWIGRVANKLRNTGEMPNNITTNCNIRNDGSLFSTNCGFGNEGDSTTSAAALGMLDNYVNGVELRVPGREEYAPVKPDFVYYSPSDDTFHYMANADVTDLINPNAQMGEYYVQGVNTKLHGYNHGTYGGWMLYVIYENKDDTAETFKNITVFDGLKHTESGVEFEIGGFRTPIAQGADVEATLFYLAGDGDATEKGDCFKFNWPDSSANCSQSLVTGYTHSGIALRGKAVYIGGKGISDANAFNASVTYGGIPNSGGIANSDGAAFRGNPQPGSLPSFGYTQGFDLHTYNIKNVLGNNQQKTRVIMRANGDYFAPSFLALATQIHAPNISEMLQEAKLSACTNNKNIKGRTMDYTLTFTNTGSERAYNIAIHANLDDSEMGDLIDLSKTRVDGIYRVNGTTEERIDPSMFTCAVTEGGLVAVCSQKSTNPPTDAQTMDIGETYRMKYSVTFADNAKLSDVIESYASNAQLVYWNYTTRQQMEVDAIVKTPFRLAANDCRTPNCLDPKLAIPVMTTRTGGGVGDEGYFIIKPSQSEYGKYLDVNDSFNEPFLAYCAGISAYNASVATGKKDEDLIEVYLPLPMSDPDDSGKPYDKPNSNFAFGQLTGNPVTNGASGFYHQGYERIMFDRMEMDPLETNPKTGVIIGLGPKEGGIYNLRINISDLSLHQSMYVDRHGNPGQFEFSNINLVGTSFAIDRDASGFYCAGYPLPTFGFYDQIAKSPTAGLCIAKPLVFKQLERYKYLDTSKHTDLKDRKFYESCSQVKSRNENEKNGFYLINPPDNTRIPFAADCIMEDTAAGKEHQYITTIFMAFDARNAYVPESMLENTCTDLGLAFFVPTNKSRFENMRNYLVSNKDGAEGWAGYVGNLYEWETQNMLFYGSGSLGNAYGTRLVWPYGPFGVFADKEGEGTSSFDADKHGKGKAPHSPGMNSKNPSEPPTATMGHYGWVTIFDDATPIGTQIRTMMQKMEGLSTSSLDKTWWIADEPNTDHPEPNGDYDRKTWLGYAFDDTTGDFEYLNDTYVKDFTATNLPRYTHHSYACVGLDSYFPIKRTRISDLAVWEAAGASANDQKIYTKMADSEINLKIGAKPEDGEAEGRELEARVCARIVEESPIGSGKYTAITGWQFVDFAGEKAKDLTIGKTDRAVRQAVVEMRYMLAANDAVTAGSDGKPVYPDCGNDTAVWDTFVDPKTGAEKTKTYSLDSFSVRPAAFVATDTSKVFIAGEAYKHESGKSDPIAITTSAGYTQGVFTSGDSGLIVKGSDKAVIESKFNQGDLITTIGFVNGVSEINISYDEVGEVILNVTDKLWTVSDATPGDCLAGSYDTTVPNTKYGTVKDPNKPSEGDNPNSWKVGCWVGVEPDGNLTAAVRFVPHHFRVAQFELNSSTAIGSGGSGGSFTYYANEGDGQSLGVNLALIALNAKGATTKFYNYSAATPATEGNYSQWMDYELDFSDLDNRDTIDELKAKGATLWGSKDRWDSSIWTAGEANRTVEINFNRSVTVPLKPLGVKAADINLSVSDADARTGVGSGSGIDAKFYYGRFYAPKSSTTGSPATVQLFTELYCPQGCKLPGVLAFTTKVSDDRDWQRVEDTVSEANVTVVIGSTDQLVSSIKSGGSANIGYPIGAANPRPREFPVHLSVPPYLWHHPFGVGYKEVRLPANLSVAATRRDCFAHPCSSVEFLPTRTEQWGGVGDAETDRSFKDDATQERTPQRIGW